MTAPAQTTAPPGLEERFTEPPGWRWHVLTNAQGRKMRFGTVAPESRVPDAVVVCLQGLGEFTEKYFEVARDLLKMNLSFWMIDWQGQGKSDRHLKNPQKRHSTNFDEDVADLHFFIMEYIKHSAVHPDVGRIPLVMLGHSMGANIGLRYLHHHQDMFACAAFTAPLVEINVLKNLPSWFSLWLTGAFKEAFDHAYAGLGGGDWQPHDFDNAAKDILSSDETRKRIADMWCAHDPALQVGNVTYGWVHQANLSCQKLQKPNFLADIHTPCLMAIAGQEKLVDNAAAKQAVEAMPNASLLELPDAKHEILMERDEYRSKFFEALGKLITDKNVKEMLKPF